MSESTTACPACKGTVSFAAPICPHCGHPLDTAAVDSTGAVVGAAVRKRVEGEDLSWHMSHLFFFGRYLLAGLAPIAVIAWMIPVEPGAVDGTELASAEGEVEAGNTNLRWYVLLGSFALVSVPLVLSAIIERLSSRYTLTHDGYVRERRGLISRRTAELHVSDIRLVNLNQSLWHRIFDVGSLDISSAGHSGVEVQFKGIPDPDGVKERILDRAETSDD